MKVKHFAAWDMTAGFCLLYHLLVDVEIERGIRRERMEGKDTRKKKEILCGAYWSINCARKL